MKRVRFLHVRHRVTGETAIGMRQPGGTVLVQFDSLLHTQSHGWHLYPRHHFFRHRRRGSSRSPLPPAGYTVNQDVHVIDGHMVSTEELLNILPPKRNALFYVARNNGSS